MSNYEKAPEWERHELSEDRDRMVELFCGTFGYEHADLWDLNPTGQQLLDELRSFCKHPSRNRDDYVILYLAGHGVVQHRGAATAEYVFLPSDTDPEDARTRAIRMQDLADRMLAETVLRRIVVILDTCHSGQGGSDFARPTLDWVAEAGRMDSDAGAVIVWSAQPKQAACPGVFTTAFAKAARSWPTSGRGPHAVYLDSLMRVLTAESPAGLQKPGVQPLFGYPFSIDFLVNPDQDSGSIDIALDEQDRRWQVLLGHELERRRDMSERFQPRIAGFVGRHRALIECATWLNDPHDVRSRIVTGDPGSGKTALIGLLCALSDPLLRPSVPRGDIPSSGVPDQNVVDVVLHAGGMSAEDVASGLAAATGVAVIDDRASQLGATVTAFIAEAQRLTLGSGRPFTAVIDALDEADDPRDLADRVVRPVLSRASGSIRLLLGTRRNVADHMLGVELSRCVRLDLDRKPFADPAGILTMVRRIVLETIDGRAQRPPARLTCSDSFAHTDKLVEGIAAAAGNSFFVGRIIARTQASLEILPDPFDPNWVESLPRDAGEAMLQDLQLHLKEQSQAAIEVLRPLAYARGAGLPWEDIWPALATALSPRSYSNFDLIDLVKRAGSYVVETTSLADRSRYRLYHKSLADYLRSGRDAERDERLIAEALTATVPRRTDHRGIDWNRSHPYVLTHLSGHAATGGLLDQLVADPGYLLEASRPELLAAMATLKAPSALAARAAYNQVLPDLRRHPKTEHAAYLSLAARRAGADALAERLDAEGLSMPWTALWTSWPPEQRPIVMAGHIGDVMAVAMAKLDGRPVVVSGGSSDKTIRVWDLATGQPQGQPFTGHTGWVTALTVVELDGRQTVISGSEDQTIRVWDLATGQPLREPFTGHTAGLTALTTAEVDGRTAVISSSFDGTVRVWDLDTGQPTSSLWAARLDDEGALAVAELNDRPVASSIRGGVTRLWDLSTGAFVGRVPVVDDYTTIELDGRRVDVERGLSNGGTPKLNVGEPVTGHPVSSLWAGPARVTWDDSVWDGLGGTRNGVIATTLRGRPVAILSNSRGKVGVWDLATGAQVGVSPDGRIVEGTPMALADVDGNPVLVCGRGASLTVWDLATGEPGEPLVGHLGEVTIVSTTVLNGRPTAISGSADGTLRLWDLITSEQIGSPLLGQTRSGNAVNVAELDGQPVLVCGDNDTVRAWELGTDEAGDSNFGEIPGVWSVALAELQGRPVAVVGCGDATVRVWDLHSGMTCGYPLVGHNGPVTALAVVELEGRALLISGSEDETVRLWDLATGKPINDPLVGHTGWIMAVAAAKLREKMVVVSGSDDGTLRVWDLASGQLVGVPRVGDVGCVNALAVTELHGNPIVVYGNYDGTVCGWDLAAWEAVGLPVQRHSDSVNGIAVTEFAGNPWAVSGSYDGTVHICNLETGYSVSAPVCDRNDSVVGVAAAPIDDRRVGLVACKHGTQLLDLMTGQPSHAPLPISSAKLAVAELQGHPVLVVGVGYGLRVWDLTLAQPVGPRLTGRRSGVRSVTVADFGSSPVVVSSGDDEALRICALATGDPIGVALIPCIGTITAVSVTEWCDRPVVVYVSDGEWMHGRDLMTGEHLGTPPYVCVGVGVTGVAVTELGGRPVAVTGGHDATLRVWDLTSGRQVGNPLMGHGGAITSLAVTELGGRPVAVTGSQDATLRVWDLTSQKPGGHILWSDRNRPIWLTSTPTCIAALGPKIVIGSDQGTAVLRITRTYVHTICPAYC